MKELLEDIPTESEENNNPILDDHSRRKAVKKIVAGIMGVVCYNTFPTTWEKPVIEQIVLPAHAQTSGNIELEEEGEGAGSGEESGEGEGAGSGEELEEEGEEPDGELGSSYGPLYNTTSLMVGTLYSGNSYLKSVNDSKSGFSKFSGCVAPTEEVIAGVATFEK